MTLRPAEEVADYALNQADDWDRLSPVTLAEIIHADRIATARRVLEVLDAMFAKELNDTTEGPSYRQGYAEAATAVQCLRYDPTALEALLKETK